MQKRRELRICVFLKLNSWILSECCASWDNPGYFTKCISSNVNIKRELIKVTTYHLSSLRAIEYMGLRHYLRYGNISKLSIPWGWKDPRNTFTVEFWKEIFPSAKIVHIYRNPIDTAESLRKRELTIRKEFKHSLKTYIKQALLLGKTNILESMRVAEIHGGVGLWKEYICQASLMEERFSSDWMSIQYEDYVERPEYYLNSLSDFIGTDFDRGKLRNIVDTTQLSRKYAFLNDKELVNVYKQLKDDVVVKRLGYGNLF